MKKFDLIIILGILFLILLMSQSMVSAQNQEDNTWKNFEKSADQKWQEHTKQSEEQWDQFEKEQQEKWLKFKEDVEKKWDEFIDSTKKTWVDYGKDLEVRSEINFEDGTVDITAVIPKDTANPKDVASKKIDDQLKKIFTDDNIAKIEVLKDQVKNKKDETIDPQNLDSYIKEEIVPEIKVEEKPFIPKDGKERIKVKVRIDLVPNHIRIRAEKYLDPVNKQAGRFDVEPQLVLAIMHTESFFNPMAKSSCGALGLMQLVPRSGARDAYNFVYKKDRILHPEYLYDPENNIELGTAYVCLLRNQHFKNIDEPLKNQYLTICAYNCGPTAVNRLIAAHKIQLLDDQELYSLLRRKTPQETQDYLEKVTGRMKIYASYCN